MPTPSLNYCRRLVDANTVKAHFPSNPMTRWPRRREKHIPDSESTPGRIRAQEFQQHLMGDEDEKREVEKQVVKIFSEFVLDNPRDFIPPEYVFRVSDKALIDILFWKIKGDGLVPRVKFPMIEYNLIEPGHLSANLQPLGYHEYYFFTQLVKNRDGKFKRQTSSGYWELQHREVDITSEKGVNGKRTDQSFWEGTKRDGTKTLWKMYEYKLSWSPNEDSKIVLCKAYSWKTVDDNWAAGPQQRRSKSPEKPQEPQTLDLLPGVKPQEPQTLDLLPGGR